MFETEIAAGMALLDAKLPGWQARVDVATLNLNDCTLCVLGQLTGDFGSDDARELLEVEENDEQWEAAEHRGFAAGGEWNDSEERYDQLTAEWKSAILNRRGVSQ
jgi:hypothetical protein